MTSSELETLKKLAFKQYTEYHTGLSILLESDKSIFRAFGQSHRTKYIHTENFYLTSKERIAYLMGFIDAFAWATRYGHIHPNSFHTNPEDFVDPEETPEEREEFFHNRYAGLSEEERIELELYDKENEELWQEEIKETIEYETVLQKLVLKCIGCD